MEAVKNITIVSILAFLVWFLAVTIAGQMALKPDVEPYSGQDLCEYFASVIYTATCAVDPNTHELIVVANTDIHPQFVRKLMNTASREAGAKTRMLDIYRYQTMLSDASYTIMVRDREIAFTRF